MRKEHTSQGYYIPTIDLLSSWGTPRSETLYYWGSLFGVPDDPFIEYPLFVIRTGLNQQEKIILHCIGDLSTLSKHGRRVLDGGADLRLDCWPVDELLGRCEGPPN